MSDALSAALAAIRNSAKDRIPDLSLSGLGLTAIPPEIGELAHLETLDASENLLTELPPAMASLSRLQELLLDRNRIARLPPEIGRLRELQILSLEGAHTWWWRSLV